MKKNILIIISAFILVSIFGCSGKNESNSKKHEEKEDLKKIEKELLKKLSAKLFDNCLSSPAFVETPYQEVPNASSKGGIFFDAETMVLNKQYSYYSTRTDVFNNHLSWKTELGKISNIKFKTTDYVKGKKIPMLEADWKSDDGYSIATFNIVPIMYQVEDPESNGMLQYAMYTDNWRVMGNKSVSKEEFYTILELLGKLSKTDVSATNGTAVLNGTTTPTSSIGVNGDFYINTTTNTLYGPKTNGAWTSGTALVGQTGATGAQGTAGVNGLSAFQIWLNAGNTGTENDFLNYLSGNFPVGNNINQLLHWNGNEWILLNPGTNNQVLTIVNNNLVWSNLQNISSDIIPQVQTLNVSYDYNNYVFTINSNLLPGATPNNVGVVWSLNPNPTINDNYVSYGTLNPGNNFTTTINISLTIAPNTTYYFKSYASNNNGISYGQELSFTTGQFLIGQFYQGGIIVYINNTGEHGIIASQNTNATSLWGCNGTAVGSVGTTIGTGQQNTSAILSGCSQTNCAARICDNLILNGFSDWYLPSLDELYRIYVCRQFLNYSLGNESSHWSSSEYGNPGYSNAYYVVLSTGGIGNLPKNYSTLPVSVRAVRNF